MGRNQIIQQLSDCPCCGGGPRADGFCTDWRVVCGNCGLSTKWVGNKQEAKALWNMRPVKKFTPYGDEED